MYKLEIACFNVESAVIAQESGAHRVELCVARELGGITPSEQEVIQARKLLHIDLNVMIRPRGGNFVYDDTEFEQMCAAVLSFKALGLDGFVFGILQADHRIDIARNKKLVELAFPTPCTYHRAFDHADNREQALEDVIACGFSTILTSGGEESALLGKSNLKQLVAKAGNRITIMPGGGVRSSNIQELVLETNATYFHSSAITKETGNCAEAAEIKKMLLQ